jgi:hypothetical protein
MEDLGSTDNSIYILVVVFVVCGSAALVPDPKVDGLRRATKGLSSPAELSINIR